MTAPRPEFPAQTQPRSVYQPHIRNADQKDHDRLCATLQLLLSQYGQESFLAAIGVSLKMPVFLTDKEAETPTRQSSADARDREGGEKDDQVYFVERQALLALEARADRPTLPISLCSPWRGIMTIGLADDETSMMERRQAWRGLAAEPVVLFLRERLRRYVDGESEGDGDVNVDASPITGGKRIDECLSNMLGELSLGSRGSLEGRGRGSELDKRNTDADMDMDLDTDMAMDQERAHDNDKDDLRDTLLGSSGPSLSDWLREPTTIPQSVDNAVPYTVMTVEMLLLYRSLSVEAACIRVQLARPGSAGPLNAPFICPQVLVCRMVDEQEGPSRSRVVIELEDKAGWRHRAEEALSRLKSAAITGRLGPAPAPATATETNGGCDLAWKPARVIVVICLLPPLPSKSPVTARPMNHNPARSVLPAAAASSSASTEEERVYAVLELAPATFSSCLYLAGTGNGSLPGSEVALARAVTDAAWESLLGDVLEQPPTLGIYASAYPLARLINTREANLSPASTGPIAMLALDRLTDPVDLVSGEHTTTIQSRPGTLRPTWTASDELDVRAEQFSRILTDRTAGCRLYSALRSGRALAALFSFGPSSADI